MIMRRRALHLREPLATFLFLALTLGLLSAPSYFVKAEPGQPGAIAARPTTIVSPGPAAAFAALEIDTAQSEMTSSLEPGIGQVPGPQTALPDHARGIGMFVLLLVIISAVTLLLWRYHRRDHASPRRIGRRT
jgi:hypothetical protein